MSTSIANRYQSTCDALPAEAHESIRQLQTIEEGEFWWVPYSGAALFLVQAHEEVRLAISSDPNKLRAWFDSLDLGPELQPEIRALSGEATVGVANYLFRTRKITEIMVVPA